MIVTAESFTTARDHTHAAGPGRSAIAATAFGLAPQTASSAPSSSSHDAPAPA